MSAYTYRAIFEIERPELPLKNLIAEARVELDVMAAGDGARLVGEPIFTTSGDKLICEVPAEPLPSPEFVDVDQAKVIRACRGERIQLNRAEIVAAMEKLQREHPEMSYRDIAARLRRSASSLRKIRERATRAVACG